MKFFSLLIGCLFTFCTLKAQDSTVCIPNNVARWFLEQKDLVILLKKDLVVKEQIISNFREATNTQNRIINSYKSDSTTYNAIILTNKEHIQTLDNDLLLANKEIKRQKRLKYLALIGIGIVGIIGLL